MTNFIASDSEYFIACDFIIRDSTYKRTYSINRYSGRYEKSFAPDGSDKFLLHRGKCEIANKKF